MLKQTLLAGLLMATFSLCGLAQNGDFLKSATGLEFKIFKIGSGRNAAMGDMMTVHFVSVDHKDSILQSTYRNGQPITGFTLQKIQYNGDLSEVFPMMAAGDSAVVRVPIDSVQKQLPNQQLPPHLINGTFLTYYLKLVKMQNQVEFQEEMQRLEADQRVKDDQLIQAYLTERGLNAEALPSGLYYVRVKKGSGGKPIKGSEVSVHYTGRLLNGKVFDSSRDRGEPITFPLGQGRVIKGWDEGIALMEKGEEGLLLIPSHLGYGARGAGSDIPPFAVLIFEVELVNFKE